MEKFRNYFESSSSEEDQNMNEGNQINKDEQDNDIIMNEENEEEENLSYFKYDKKDFDKENIFQFLLENNILKNKPLCEKCQEPMNLVSNKQRVDGKIWRCKKKGSNKHDIKLNIRIGSIFENFKTDIRILYYLLFFNFVENKSVKNSFINAQEFSKLLKLEYITRKQVSKFYKTIRTKIKNKMYKSWGENKLGIEPCENGKSYCEIGGSKVITYNNETRWMFGIYGRGSKECRIFYVDNNRTKETLLPIIKNNIFTPYNSIVNNNDPNEEQYPTRIFSDCFSSYQVGDFNNLGYKLYKINHSVWFGRGNFHTNSIEGTWSKIKRLTRSFNGLNGNIFNTSSLN